MPGKRGTVVCVYEVLFLPSYRCLMPPIGGGFRGFQLLAGPVKWMWCT